MFTRLFAVSLFMGALAARVAAAATVITPAPVIGHPSLAIAVTGSGFADSEAVDVYFDTTDTLLLVSSATGTLTGSITIPASATPGAHSITAIGRHSGDAAQSVLTVSTSWSQFGFGATHLGLNPYENVLSASSVPSLGTLWESTVGATGGTPAVIDNKVYVGTSSGVMAINAATGATLWSKNLGETFDASPTVVAGVLYIGDLDGDLYALNAGTGATEWTVTLNGSIHASVVIANSIIYVGTGQGTLYALPLSGKGKTILWSYVSAAGEAITTTAAVANGNIYFASYNDYIYCLNAATGSFVWKYLVGNVIDSSPVISNGMLYIGSYDKNVYAISTAPGNAGVLQWSYTTGGGIVGTPSVANGLVYIGSGDGNMYALNARTGAVYFSLATGGSVRSPVTANGVVYFTTDLSTFFAINQYGSVLASGSTGDSFLGSPAISDGRLFIASTGGGVYAFAPGAGTAVVRTHAPPNPSSLRPDLSLPITR